MVHLKYIQVCFLRVDLGDNQILTDSLSGQAFSYANFNVSSGGCLTVGNINSTEWTPLKSGYLPSPLAGGTLGYTSNAPYLKILQIALSDLGTPFNPDAGSNTGWSCQTASSPLTNSVNFGGIELPANVGYNNYSLSDSPSVPASGTAVQNTNPFTIEVALNGGVVTEIQVTRSGYSSAFTVFSNSSGIALTGQSYRLKPGDSITLTYSTAPSWVWIP